MNYKSNDYLYDSVYDSVVKTLDRLKSCPYKYSEKRNLYINFFREWWNSKRYEDIEIFSLYKNTYSYPISPIKGEKNMLTEDQIIKMISILEQADGSCFFLCK